MIQLTDENFKNAIDGSTHPILIQFSAQWCGPCKTLTPIVEQLSTEMEHITFVKVDVDDCPEIAQKYGIRSVPTLILFENGKQLATTMGVLNKQKLIDFISKHIPVSVVS